MFPWVLSSDGQRSNQTRALPRFSRRSWLLQRGLRGAVDFLGLVRRGRRELGEVFAIDGMFSPFIVVADADALLVSPALQPLAELRRGLAFDDRWASCPDQEQAFSRFAPKLLAAKTLRLQVERVVDALQSELAAWPEQGCLPAAEAFGRLAAVAISAAFWADAPSSVVDALAQGALKRGSTMGSLKALLGGGGRSFGPADGQLFAAARRCMVAAPDHRTMARDLLRVVVSVCGPRDLRPLSEWLAAVMESTTFHLAAVSHLVMQEVSRDAPWLADVLEEQDRVHGDQGDATFETLRAATQLELVLEQLERAAPPQRLLLARLRQAWRVGDHLLPKDSRVLLPREGLPALPLWTQQQRVEKTLSRPLVKALWSVLWREVDLCLEGDTLRFTKRDY